MSLLAPVKMRIVPPDTDQEEMAKGDTMIYTRENNSLGIICACPQCGYVVSHTPHIYNEVTKSATPSLLCLKCDFHGYLTNGEYKNC